MDSLVQLLATTPVPGITGPTESASLQPLTVVMGLFGGLALFLYGLDQLTRALKAVAGGRMKRLLGTLTTNRLTGVLTGAFVTSIIQSSSVTTVLVVGFISAGLMSVSQSIGVIMGANIGTTVTAQVIALKVTKYALLLIALGFGMGLIGKRERVKQYGQVLLGLGLVFFGMAVMGEAMAPLASYEPFIEVMSRMERPLLGILGGALFTMLVQSSSATTGVVIVMAGQGLISLPAGIAMILGSNVGTCVTAMLAATGKPREALRASLVHVSFNVAGVLLWLGLIDQLAALVARVSPTRPDLVGVARLAAETPRQIANAHTVFNVVNTAVLIGFAPWFARFVEWLAPDRPVEEERTLRAKYLDSGLLSTPSLALDRALMEILHLGDRVAGMYAEILPALVTGDREMLEDIEQMDDAVDTLHGYIVSYLGRISQGTLTDRQMNEFLNLMEATNDLESIGDIIETNLVALGRQRIRNQITISAPTRQVIEQFHATVGHALESSLQAVTQRNREAAERVVGMKREINRLAEAAAMHEAKRLVAAEPNRLPSYAMETDVLENLKRVYYFTKRMSRAVLRTGADEKS